MTTHNFGPGRRVWGHNYEIMQIEEGGQRLKLAVWSQPKPRPGDLMLLDNNGSETRYEVASVESVRDPDDMCFADVVFAPRPAEVTP